jgi:hypothetical protein
VDGKNDEKRREECRIREVTVLKYGWKELIRRRGTGGKH